MFVCECQKRLLLSRQYDPETETLLYICPLDDGRKYAIAFDCEDQHDYDAICGTDKKVLDQFMVQCCSGCTSKKVGKPHLGQ